MRTPVRDRPTLSCLAAAGQGSKAHEPPHSEDDGDSRQTGEQRGEEWAVTHAHLHSLRPFSRGSKGRPAWGATASGTCIMWALVTEDAARLDCAHSTFKKQAGKQRRLEPLWR